MSLSWLAGVASSVSSVSCVCANFVSLQIWVLFCLRFSLCQSRMIFFIILRPCCGLFFESRFIEPIVCPILFVTLYSRVGSFCALWGILVSFPLRRGGGCGFFSLHVCSLFRCSFCLCSFLRAVLISVVCVMESYS